MKTRNYGSLFERVERIQTSVEYAERKTIYVEPEPERFINFESSQVKECVTKEFRL